MAREHVTYLVAEPRVVSRLDRDAHPIPERAQGCFQTRGLDPHIGWELEEHRPEVRAELRSMRQQSLDGLVRIA